MSARKEYAPTRAQKIELTRTLLRNKFSPQAVRFPYRIGKVIYVDIAEGSRKMTFKYDPEEQRWNAFAKHDD